MTTWEQAMFFECDKILSNFRNEIHQKIERSKKDVVYCIESGENPYDCFDLRDYNIYTLTKRNQSSVDEYHKCMKDWERDFGDII